MRSLHWLPVRSRIIFKILILVCKSIHGLLVSELIKAFAPESNLQSVIKNRLIEQRIRLVTFILVIEPFIRLVPHYGTSLTMTVHDGGFKHTAQKAEHISKGSVLALTLVAGRSNGCFFMVQQPCPGSLSPGLLANACTITYLTRWKERGTIRFIPELVHNLASALALRAPLAMEQAAPSYHFKSYTELFQTKPENPSFYTSKWIC